ncbi:MAG TPA: S53 family peptidase [Acidobacteriaceae bacterium]|nr:S53 family peptidase [Acidobacteriaceae bacterium]
MILSRALSLAAPSVMSLAILASPAIFAQRITNSVPAGVRQASDLGRVNATETMTVTVHLQLQNKAAFDREVDALYDPVSPTYHKWLTNADLAKYAPAREHAAAVRKELETHGLEILSADEVGFSIRVRGTVANVENAFNTEIHQFQRNGKVFRANLVSARLTGLAGDYVAAVSGLESHLARPALRRAVNLKTGQPPPTVALSKVQASGGLASLITDQILYTPSAYLLSTADASLPLGVFFGNVYGADPDLIPGYTPAQLQALYGLPTAYQAGFDGTGQTIVLLEAFGYPTIEADANAFFKLTGLPAFTPSNFKIIYPQGPPVSPNAGVLTGWDFEIALDVQWAHSIAPGAKIVVVLAAGQDNESLQAAMQSIINEHLGNTISDSWEVDTDLVSGPLEEQSFDQLLEIAAAKGISFQFSTGDEGDAGLGSPIGAAGVPSNSPHATAVGGTSIVNNINSSGYETLGWGNSFVLLDSQGVQDPPAPYPSYFGGSGGGESVYFPKPSWQASLPGTGRQTPDVSALADPYTGVPIVITSGGVQGVQVGWGGTSLACPIVTALWAIANQYAGHPMGQAAPYIAGLKPGALIDVLPLSSVTNVTGTIVDSSGAIYYSAASLFAGQTYGSAGFTSAIVAGNNVAFALSFGLDSSLTVTQGWDNVTGWGTPNVNTFLSPPK